jgi:2-methylfumaryl-CoA isomerase
MVFVKSSQMNSDLLQGLRIVESSAFIAAPLAGMTLAQSGADVIRIDMPGGGIDYRRLPMSPAGRSFYWTGLNKGKRSFAVDLRHPQGQELVRALVTDTDPSGGVLLTNLGTSWLSHDGLSASRPDLISCTIEGNPDGSTAVDYTVNCATGFPMMTGQGTRKAPVNHALPAWDIACAYQAAFAITAAVARRQRQGIGAQLRMALSDVAFATVSHLGLSAEAELMQRDRPAMGNDLYGAFGRDFGSSDGARFFVAAISLSQWNNLLKACELEPTMRELEARTGLDFRKEGDRFEAREVIAQKLAEHVSTMAMAQIAECFNRHGVCWGPYQTVSEALRQDPRLSTANPMFEPIETAGIGRHLAAGSTVRENGATRAPVQPAPVLGQHTDEILMDILRLDAGAVGRLHDAGIVAGPECDPLLGAAR